MKKKHDYIRNMISLEYCFIFLFFISIRLFAQNGEKESDIAKTILNLNKKGLTEIPSYVFDQKELKVLKKSTCFCLRAEPLVEM